jgi:hypothetical protein
MTQRLTVTINNKILPANGAAQRKVWRAVKVSLVAFAVHLLSWGGLHLLEA